MGCACKQDMVKVAGLLMHGGHQIRMTVTVDAGPPRGDAIDDFTAIRQPKPRPLRAVDDQRDFLKTMPRVRMPDARGIAGQEPISINGWVRLRHGGAA